MTITLNNHPLEISEEEITVAELVARRKFPENGTAVAVNDTLVTRSKWEGTCLRHGDRVTVISAAFGG